VKQVAGRVGWRHKASAEAYRLIANPPQNQLFLVGLLSQCSERAKSSDANPPYKEIVFVCKSIEQNPTLLPYW